VWALIHDHWREAGCLGEKSGILKLGVKVQGRADKIEKIACNGFPNLIYLKKKGKTSATIKAASRSGCLRRGLQKNSRGCEDDAPRRPTLVEEGRDFREFLVQCRENHLGGELKVLRCGD